MNQAIASKYLGHTDIATTAKFYQKIRPEVLRATLDKMKGTTGTTKIM